MSGPPWSVLFTANATTQIEVIEVWWSRERRDAPNLFVDELTAAVDRLTRLPRTGATCRWSRVQGLRRVLLPRCRYHLYYTIQPGRRQVIVRAAWHASRGQAPRLD